MWESVGCGKGLTWEKAHGTTRTDNMTWMVDGMKNNTITWCTDGSYHRKHTPKVSGAGWIAYCTRTNNNMAGSFYEISDDAGFYRGEQIGLCTIHVGCNSLLLRAKLQSHSCTLLCGGVRSCIPHSYSKCLTYTVHHAQLQPGGLYRESNPRR